MTKTTNSHRVTRTKAEANFDHAGGYFTSQPNDERHCVACDRDILAHDKGGRCRPTEDPKNGSPLLAEVVTAAAALLIGVAVGVVI